MAHKQEKAAVEAEGKIKGCLFEEGVKVRISENGRIGELISKGYGVAEDKTLVLTFYEALYLSEKGVLDVEDELGVNVDFKRLLQVYERLDENAWAKYLVYRDLRGRGYVVREGFGLGVDFRVYERGEYGKDTAKYLILNIQEGKPMPFKDLARIMKQCLSLKKELVLAVMNRRGEIVYYSLSQLTMP